MDRFMFGLTGIGLGFMVFLPSYLFGEHAANGSTDTTYTVSMILGAAVMYATPLIFWVIMPLTDKLRR